MSVGLERRRHVATVVVDRPPMNVLDLATLDEIDGVLRQVGALDDLAAVVVRGAGERAFSAGVDVADHTPEKIEPMLGTFHRALRRLHRLEAVTVALVDGHCLGGGLELALACDLRLATRRSTFGQPEIRLACFAPVASVLLPAQLSPARAADLLLTGRMIDAEAAAAWGLVSRLGDAAGPLLAELLDELGAHSRPALRLAKRALRLGRPDEALFADALAASERLYLEELAELEDLDEAVRAFAERRPPEWKHR